MTKMPEARTSRVNYDGELPVVLNSGRMTNAASAQFGNVLVAPCKLYIESVQYYIDTQFTHASSKLNIGSLADDDAYIDGLALQNVATGLYEADLSAVTTISRIIPKGTPVCFSLDSADTTGKISATAVLVPYSQRV